MLQYCRSLGDCEKERVKSISTWSAFYFSHPRSWYPQPEGTIHFQEMRLMKSLPARDLSLGDCQKLTEFASVHGRAVRQRSVRQETTMAKAGTSPPACY